MLKKFYFKIILLLFKIQGIGAYLKQNRPCCYFKEILSNVVQYGYTFMLNLHSLKYYIRKIEKKAYSLTFY